MAKGKDLFQRNKSQNNLSLSCFIPILRGFFLAMTSHYVYWLHIHPLILSVTISNWENINILHQKEAQRRVEKEKKRVNKQNKSNCFL